MKVLLTGGHFSPAYSLIKELKARGDSVAIAGRRKVFENDDSESLEYKISRKEKIKFFEVNTGRFQRKFSPDTVPSLIKIAGGLFDSLRIINEYKPDVILTFGGYIAFPVVYAAFFRRIPVVLHEQTPKAGLASRAISKIVSKICISFETSRSYFPKSKIVFTGMPIREEIFSVKNSFEVNDKKPILYITGGSSGSHFINLLVTQTLEALASQFTIIHQTGDNQEFKDNILLSEKREALPQGLKEDYIIRKFIYPDEIGFVLNKARLVVSRSGINTVVELLALGKPCFLIPLSHGQTGEQLYNAKLVQETGIGSYTEERYLTANKFLDEIMLMKKNIKELEKNKLTASHYIVTDAIDRIIKVVDEVYEKKKK